MSSPDFQRYLINTLKLSVYGLLWGFPIPILLAFLLNRIESKKIKQKTEYEIASSDWSSDVCSSDLALHLFGILVCMAFLYAKWR